ncbi:MAG TPA: hypothetical protein DCQ64_10790 [Candidatus Rokubacteria bacterium]|nr:hypothetical protein [Candidatus Rokubacteria bacterium]
MSSATDFPIVLQWSEDDRAFIALSPHWPGLSGESVNASTAVDELCEAIEMAIANGSPLPCPSWQLHAGPVGYEVASRREGETTWRWTPRRESLLDALSDAAAGRDVLDEVPA